MAPEERKPNTPLMDRLFEEWFEFSFFSAVHLLDTLTDGKEPLGQAQSPAREAVRFSVKPGFSFPPSDISGLRRGEEGRPAVMDVAFLGLIGPSGVLPHWLNELAMDRIRRKDFSLPAFLDMFHHRLISLFYLAWKKHRFTVNYLPGAKDRLSGYLLSLMGLGAAGMAGALSQPLESLIFYSGLLSRQVPCAAAIERAVEYFTGVPAAVEQFVDRTIELAPEDRTRVGRANARLGVDAICGSCVWESQTRFRVNLGPMGYRSFLRLMPSGDMLEPVFSLIRLMVGIEYEVEVRVFLRPEEAPLCVLGQSDPSAPRLGWSTWVKAPDAAMRKSPFAAFEDKGLGRR